MNIFETVCPENGFLFTPELITWRGSEHQSWGTGMLLLTGWNTCPNNFSIHCTLYNVQCTCSIHVIFPFNETNKCEYDYLMTDKTGILKGSNFERKHFWWGKSLLTKGATSEMARTVTSLVLLRKRDQNDICRILF